eukprot:1288551-Amphidinium_carterae.1
MDNDEPSVLMPEPCSAQARIFAMRAQTSYEQSLHGHFDIRCGLTGCHHGILGEQSLFRQKGQATNERLPLTQIAVANVRTHRQFRATSLRCTECGDAEVPFDKLLVSSPEAQEPCPPLEAVKSRPQTLEEMLVTQHGYAKYCQRRAIGLQEVVRGLKSQHDALCGGLRCIICVGQVCVTQRKKGVELLGAKVICVRGCSASPLTALDGLQSAGVGNS